MNFLDLPRELRDEIYYYLLYPSMVGECYHFNPWNRHHCIDFLGNIHHEPRISLPVLAVNRQLRGEASEVFVVNNTFSFNMEANQVIGILHSLPAPALRQMRSVRLVEDAVSSGLAGNRRDWCNLGKMMIENMAVREVTIEVPYDPELGTKFPDEAIDKFGKVRRMRYWWPLLKGLTTMLVKGQISHQLRLLQRCEFPELTDVEDVRVIKKLRALWSMPVPREVRKALNLDLFFEDIPWDDEDFWFEYNCIAESQTPYEIAAAWEPGHESEMDSVIVLQRRRRDETAS